MHKHSTEKGNQIRDIILGGQDGLVNVLGIVLAIAVATKDPHVVIIAGLAAVFTESISMGAVAYTSVKAARQYYNSMVESEINEIDKEPRIEKREIYEIYHKKGFRGTLLNRIVSHIVSDKKLWVNTMMQEELGLSPEEYGRPGRSATIVFVSALIGSFLPLIPFIFLPVEMGIYGAITISLAALFFAGAIRARVTIGTWWRSGLELASIGVSAALAGFVIGIVLGAI